MAGRSPTLGWEASVATVSLGQSFATDSEATLVSNAKPGDYNFKRRTYLLWEPQLGGLLADDTVHPFGFTGVGGSVGMRWDRVAGADRTHFGALGGMFIAGGVAGGAGGGCDTTGSPYFSLSVGFRGSEFYVIPKVGGILVPKICFSTSDSEDWGF